MADKKCRRCGLWNSPVALGCDCGLDFTTGRIESTYHKLSSRQKFEEDFIFIYFKSAWE